MVDTDKNLCPATQAVSCSSSKWQFSPQLTDSLLSPRCPYQLNLPATPSSRQAENVNLPRFFKDIDSF